MKTLLDPRCVEDVLARFRRRELEELLRKATTVDPFAEYYLSQTVADQIVITYAGPG